MPPARTTHPAIAGLTIRQCRANGECKCQKKYGYGTMVRRWGGWGLINRRLCGDKYAAAIQTVIEKERAKANGI